MRSKPRVNAIADGAVSADLAQAKQALSLPDDKPRRSTRELCEQLTQAGASVTYVTQSAGCGPVLLARDWLSTTSRPLIYVAATAEQWVKAVDDFGALLPEAAVVALPPSESNPYSATQPDRRATMTRLGALQ